MRGKGSDWEPQGGPQPHEANFLRLDCAKAKARLGWAPRTDLKLALEWVAEWHRRCEGKEDMRKVTEEQIDRFCSLKGR